MVWNRHILKFTKNITVLVVKSEHLGLNRCTVHTVAYFTSIQRTNHSPTVCQIHSETPLCHCLHTSPQNISHNTNTFTTLLTNYFITEFWSHYSAKCKSRSPTSSSTESTATTSAEASSIPTATASITTTTTSEPTATATSRRAWTKNVTAWSTVTADTLSCTGGPMEGVRTTTFWKYGSCNLSKYAYK